MSAPDPLACKLCSAQVAPEQIQRHYLASHVRAEIKVDVEPVIRRIEALRGQMDRLENVIESIRHDLIAADAQVQRWHGVNDAISEARTRAAKKLPELQPVVPQ